MKLQIYTLSYGVRYRFFCPGCNTGHVFEVRNDGRQPSWTFDGDMERPTVSPSLLMPALGCHLFLRAGRIEYLPDCQHGLAGQTIDLPDLADVS